MVIIRCAVALVLFVSVTACGAKHMRADVTQPNPLADPNETLRTSATAVIISGDKDLYVPRVGGEVGLNRRLYSMQRYPLRNMVSFTVVSRDRLRFHVQLEHKWKEYANLDNWEVELRDGQGNVYRPSSVEGRDPELVTAMWDHEVNTAERDATGNLTGVRNDGHLRRQPLGNMTLFRGRGDFVFYRRDILTPRTSSLTLILRRKDLVYEFAWTLESPTSTVATR